MTYSLPQHIDSTMIACFRSCPQKFWLEFCGGFRPPGISIDLHAGACFASAMENTYEEIWVGNKSLPEALDIARAKFFIQWGDFEIPAYKKTAKTSYRTWEAVEDYFDQYPPRTDHVQPYFQNGRPTFEFTFAIPLDPEEGFPLHPSGEPFIYSGRFDMLGAYQGRPCVRDEKTTGGSISTGWAEKWDLRSQFLGYVWACQQSGIDLDTVVVRGIAIQKTQIVHAEAIKTYSNFLVSRWLDQVKRDLHRMRKCYDEGYFDFNLADACTQFGSCIFLPVCQSPNPDAWLSNFEVRHWNPLAKDPTEAAATASMNGEPLLSLGSANYVAPDGPVTVPGLPTQEPSLTFIKPTEQ
jgi:hypothetical protein